MGEPPCTDYSLQRDPVADTTAPFAKFPSIAQFRHVVKDVREFAGDDETICFRGTVKLHGTNGGIGWNGETLSAQSRNRVITPDNDNHGFAAFVGSRSQVIVPFMQHLSDMIGNDNNVYIFGEWCGRGIQKGVAIAELEPLFVVFGAAHQAKRCSEDELTWFDVDDISTGPWKVLNAARIHFIYEFPHFNMNICFAQSELGMATNELAALTKSVEERCPVARQFGVDGIGEGVVWHGSCVHRDTIHHLRFKVKGSLHASTKVTTLAAVEVEKLDSVDVFITNTTTESRLEQGLKETSGDQPPTDADIGPFIRWMRADIIKEEADTMHESGISAKELGKPLAAKCRAWILSKLNGV